VCLAGACAAAVPCMWHLLTAPHPRWPMLALWGLMTLGCLCGLYLYGWVYRRLEIRVGQGKLAVGFPGDPVTVNIADIEWGAAQRLSYWDGVLIGRSLHEGARVLAARRGWGMRIHLPKAERDLIFSTNHPEQVARALGKELLPKPPPAPGVWWLR
jgi:hypothetical protein